MGEKPILSGVKVLDLSRVLAGPLCSALLGDLGAEVIKVEVPGSGDDSRQFGPYQGEESAYFMMLNRNKQSITLNLKSEEGRMLLHQLVAKADVLVENFRPGVTERLAVDYKTLSAINPRLVYVSISGFGQIGPLAHRPAYDHIVQAMGGLMSLTGWPETPPTRVGESIGDVLAGVYGSWGALAALLHREQTGTGQHVDVAMMDCMFSLMVTALSQHLYGGNVPGRIGNRHSMSAPLDSYSASDGFVVIAVANDNLFAVLAAAIGRPELSSDERFATDGERVRNEPKLRLYIEEWTSRHTVEEVVSILEGAGVPVAPIWDVAQAANSEHIRHRRMLKQVTHPKAGEITLMQQPLHFSGMPESITGPSPMLGEHTEEVLSKLLNLDAEAIAELRKNKVI
ncbi:CoA transferase [Paenibacillus sp. 7124]|uniref:CoA transferase n=1 Tax=Paenibacillus apii TaxID=1850370 RepID=A0A6M1PGN3_9BACL|nr:CoA transferase [Paenibacillus apii]NGM82440.1 CoA transferase [Paenibacillus apii]NJJ39577.1 CoA transferase [Paenibacillus apii]